MKASMFSPLHRLLLTALQRKTRVLSPEEMLLRSLVFAPHADDETLGCGGTVVSKLRAGARVSLAFMTDSSRSHLPWMAPAKMREVRLREACAAAAALGLSRDSLLFLDFEDTTLSTCGRKGIARVCKAIEEVDPQAVFVPYAHDGPPDHEATYWIVVTALRQTHRAVNVYEYPIWFWHHPPWTGLPAGLRRHPRTLIRSAAAGLRLLCEMDARVPIRHLHEIKRAALAEHRSQLERPAGIKQWPTLGDVANGKFLACFFGPYEFFRCNKGSVG